VWCQLIPPCRPSIRFLSISSQVSPSLPPPGRLPFQSWLQVVVVALLSCMVSQQGTLTPFAARPCWAHTNQSTECWFRSAAPASVTLTLSLIVTTHDSCIGTLRSWRRLPVPA
jgi:hypothetical protein